MEIQKEKLTTKCSNCGMVYSTSIKECPKCGKQYNTTKQQEVKNTKVDNNNCSINN